MSEEAMIVITRNGRTIVLTGWRAWLAGAALFVAATLVIAVVLFVMLGIAVTIGAVLLIVVPVAIGIALLASLLHRPNLR
jgi:hypothetical protein